MSMKVMREGKRKEGALQKKEEKKKRKAEERKGGKEKGRKREREGIPLHVSWRFSQRMLHGPGP